MEKEKRELTDLLVNEMGHLVEIPGMGRAIEYGDNDLSRLELLEFPVNKISDCFCYQGWCEENYYQEEDEKENHARQEESTVCFGFNPQYVDPYRGW